MRPTIRHAAAAALLLLALAACAPTAGSGRADGDAGTDAAAGQASDAAGEPAVATVHKSPTCDCCGGHEDYLDDEGFPTRAEVHEEDLTAWKEARGIPRELWSCHTTEIDGYLVEGHVPAETIARLLAERPDVDGIALPGMPAGSPGMGGVQDEPWIIEAFADGQPAGVFETR